MIAVDQDTLGKQGDRLKQEGLQEIWSKPLSGGATAVALFNRTPNATPMTLDLASTGMSSGARLHDIWNNQDVTVSGGSYTATVPGHGVVLLRVSQLWGWAWAAKLSRKCLPSRAAGWLPATVEWRSGRWSSLPSEPPRAHERNPPGTRATFRCRHP